MSSSTGTQGQTDTSTSYDIGIHLTPAEQQITEQFVDWIYTEGIDPDSMPRQKLLADFYTWRVEGGPASKSQT